MDEAIISCVSSHFIHFTEQCDINMDRNSDTFLNLMDITADQCREEIRVLMEKYSINIDQVQEIIRGSKLGVYNNIKQ